MAALALASTAVASVRTVKLARSTRAVAARRAVTVRAAMKEDANVKNTTAAVEDKLNEFFELATTKWEQSENKPGIIAVGVGALLALYFTDSVVTTVDHIPVFNTMFELLGLAVSAWFAYKWVAVPGEKARIIDSIKDFAAKVGIEL